jgi:uncharacterized protein
VQPRDKKKAEVAMRVHVDEIKDSGLELIFEPPPDTFETLAEITRAGDVRFAAPLVVQVRMKPLRKMFVAEGTLRTTVALTCSRCLAEFQSILQTRFLLTYVRVDNNALPGSETREQRLPPDEIGLHYFSGEVIDLREAIQEEVVMALPTQPLCRPECSGLCAQCGADLNKGDCGCRRKAADPRFAVLKGLKIGDR